MKNIKSFEKYERLNESTARDFMSEYGKEVKRAMAKLRKISKAIKEEEWDNVVVPIFRKMETIYDQPTVDFVDSVMADDKGRLTLDDATEVVIEISNRFGTEAFVVLDSMEHMIGQLARKLSYIKESVDEEIFEKRHIVVKRKYGVRPATTVGKNGPVRNKILSAVSEGINGKISEKRLREYIASMNETTGTKTTFAWVKNNSKYFNRVQEQDGTIAYTLSERGKRVLAKSTLNEGAVKTIQMLFKNKRIKDLIKQEKVDDIRDAIEQEGYDTTNITDAEILEIAKRL